MCTGGEQHGTRAIPDYIIMRRVRSQNIPELQIVDVELFKEANKMVSLRCNTDAEARKIAQKAENNTLPVSYTHLDVYKRQVPDGRLRPLSRL